jgi:hypothetical protein
MRKTLTTVLVIFAVCAFGSVHASLIDNGNNLIYDTDLNITWYDNPNYETIVYASYVTWAAGLNVGGVTGWRLPTTTSSTTGELGHLFFVELQNTTTTGFANHGPFDNIGVIQDGRYGGFYANDGGAVYYFDFDSGTQGPVDPQYWYWNIHAIAVHDGNVGGSSVPIPAAVWLLGSGLIGLIGIRRFRK